MTEEWANRGREIPGKDTAMAPSMAHRRTLSPGKERRAAGATASRRPSEKQPSMVDVLVPLVCLLAALPIASAGIFQYDNMELEVSQRAK